MQIIALKFLEICSFVQYAIVGKIQEWEIIRPAFAVPTGKLHFIFKAVSSILRVDQDCFSAHRIFYRPPTHKPIIDELHCI